MTITALYLYLTVPWVSLQCVSVGFLIIRFGKNPFVYVLQLVWFAVSSHNVVGHSLQVLALPNVGFTVADSAEIYRA